MPWLEYLLAVDWTTAGKTVVSALVGAGLGSALVQGWFSAIAARRRQTVHATYLAMRLTVLLDAFGLDCSDVIDRNDDAEQPPDLPELPPSGRHRGLGVAPASVGHPMLAAPQ